MKPFLAAFLVAFFMSGCVGNYLDSLPAGEFKTFKYHRGGNVTSADIIATGGKVEGNTQKIESIIFKGDYGPVFNLQVELEGYERIKPEDRGF